MNRRDFVANVPVVTASIGAATGSVTGAFDATRQEGTESEDDDDGSEIDTDLFPSGVTIAWITDRFVQVRGPDAPAVGHDVETTGLLLETVESVDEYEVLADTFAWTDFDYTGTNAFSELLSEVAWPLNGDTSFPDSFFDDYELAWLSGVTDDYYRSAIADQDADSLSMPSDQLFYSIYGHTPMLFAVVPADESPDSGTIVDISATVRHTSGDDSDINTPDGGGYLEVDAVGAREVVRTPDADWGTNQQAEFVGIQHHPRPRLASATTDVAYSDDLRRPTGGSVVWKRGTVTEAAGESADGGTLHELDSEEHDIIVGDALPSTWEDVPEEENDSGGAEDENDSGVLDDEDDEQTRSASDDSEPINISIVVDTSSSMDEQDTGRESGGKTLSRLDAVKKDLITLMDLIEDEQKVSIVGFDDDANLIEPVTLVNDGSREQLKDSVRGLSEGGNTSIGGGMQLGMESVLDESGPKTVILLSDGEENRSPTVADVLPTVRNEGIEVHTIGIGTGIDESQLEQIAEQTDGDSLIDPDVDALRQFYFEMAGNAQQRSTLSRVEEELGEEDTMSDECQVDSSCEDAQFSLSYEGSEMVLTVVDPDGNELSESDDSVSRRVGSAHEVWSVEEPPTGAWQYDVEVKQVDAPQETFAQATANSTVDGNLYVSNDLYEATGYVRFQLVVSEGFQRYTDASAYAEVIPPSGDAEDAEEIPLFDDGRGRDDVAGDGIYSNYYHPTEPGEYQVRTVVEGGEYSELRREFTHSPKIDAVVEDPVQPWEDRSPRESGSDESGSDDGSWIDVLGENPVLAALGTVGVLGTVGGLGAGGWWYYNSRGVSADGTSDATGNGEAADGRVADEGTVDRGDDAVADGEATGESDGDDAVADSEATGESDGDDAVADGEATGESDGEGDRS